MGKLILNKSALLYFKTPENQSYKFGYYNYSPINKDGTKLLAHRINFEGRMPKADDMVDIGYFSLPDGQWIKLAESKAFNWQQGSMLQWLGPDYKSKIIYNDAIGGKYIARMIDLETGDRSTIPHAIYGIDPRGKFSISLNFERCHYTRAYSYAPVVNEKWNERIPSNDGIVKIDLKSGKVKTIINLKDFLNFEGIKDDGETMHWFEHVMLNPTGTRFIFYHRYGSKDSFLTNLYTADINGKNIWKHPAKKGDQLAHLAWMDDNNYVITTSYGNKLKNAWQKKSSKDKKKPLFIWFYRKFMKPFMPVKIARIAMNTGIFYTLTKDKAGIISKLLPDQLNQDGHPGFTQNGRFMLTDTYADQEGYRHLLLCDLENDIITELGKFYSTYNNCGWRADLHPRFSPDENKVIIDSAHNGQHQMMVLEIKWDKLY